MRVPQPAASIRTRSLAALVCRAPRDALRSASSRALRSSASLRFCFCSSPLRRHSSGRKYCRRACRTRAEQRAVQCYRGTAGQLPSLAMPPLLRLAPPPRAHRIHHEFLPQAHQLLLHILCQLALHPLLLPRATVLCPFHHPQPALVLRWVAGAGVQEG